MVLMAKSKVKNRAFVSLKVAIPLALSLVAALAVVLDAAPARASLGFTTIFDPSNVPSEESPSYWTLLFNGSPITNDPTCGSYPDPDSACVDTSQAQLPDLPYVFIGASDNSADALNQAETSWQWQNNTGQNYFVSFSVTLVPNIESSTATATFQVGQFVSGSISTGQSSSANSYLVGPSEYVKFNIYVPGGSPAAGLDVTGFSYAVPGPLPAAGAATAFGYSRRLRRRIKGQPGGGGRRRAPSDPSSYLNLPPLALQAIPVSFSYVPLAAASHVQRPSIGAAGCRFVAAD